MCLNIWHVEKMVSHLKKGILTSMSLGECTCWASQAMWDDRSSEAQGIFLIFYADLVTVLIQV